MNATTEKVYTSLQADIPCPEELGQSNEFNEQRIENYTFPHTINKYLNSKYMYLVLIIWYNNSHSYMCTAIRRI